jgi:hypothetical protein
MAVHTAVGATNTKLPISQSPITIAKGWWIEVALAFACANTWEGLWLLKMYRCKELRQFPPFQSWVQFRFSQAIICTLFQKHVLLGSALESIIRLSK